MQTNIENVKNFDDKVTSLENSFTEIDVDMTETKRQHTKFRTEFEKYIYIVLFFRKF